MPWALEHPKLLETHVARVRQMRGMFDLGQDFGYGIFDRDETELLGGTGSHARLGAGAREIG
jgi:hypothetical protein